MCNHWVAMSGTAETWDMETVERETILDAPPEEVWEALTDDDRLSEWLAEEAEIDAVEGGELTIREADGGERHGTVETVIEQERLVFTWARPGEAPSLVDFTIEAVPAGTRVRVVETSGSTAWAPKLSALPRACALAFA
jgi:uncharacterized protein YndB with AHSA1/START domain